MAGRLSSDCCRPLLEGSAEDILPAASGPGLSGLGPRALRRGHREAAPWNLETGPWPPAWSVSHSYAEIRRSGGSDLGHLNSLL